MGEKQDIKFTVEFLGGLDMLFRSSKEELSMPTKDELSGERLVLSHLIQALADDGNRIRKPGTDRKLFVQEDNTVRPGILVLINETDWELEGEEKYEIQDGDHIIFVSTLHGG
ncbi:ubiquitin related modifier 1 [Polyplosphaeria fusca]|uniref:Ubiquitin-related modifier 1 n=1 Tax=Polyplosphaeria fusca TaxID=682080 RepID=A0A9P4QZG4_9PLEO|nr:ubiquitin related modifier 1 [Polyplosphaeria fusca]